jgi:hypothetical protein
MKLSVLANDVAQDKEDTEFYKIFAAQVRAYIKREAMYSQTRRRPLLSCTSNGIKLYKASCKHNQICNPLALLKGRKEHEISYQEN